MKIQLLDHTNTGWTRRITITYEGKRYPITLTWESWEGYEIINGYNDLPESLKEKYPEGLDLYCLLDDTTSEQLDKHYKEEEIK
jgi:hypothetical protein